MRYGRASSMIVNLASGAATSVDEDMAMAERQRRQRNNMQPAVNGDQPAPRASQRGQQAPLQPNPSINRAARSGRPTEDEQLLTSPATTQHMLGPFAFDFTSSDPWRVLRIQGEFVHGFDTLAHIGPAVTVFGSARIDEHDAVLRQGGHRRPATRRGRLRHHHGRWAGHHGGGESGRARRRRPVCRLQYRAAARAGHQRLRETSRSISATSSSARRCS